MQKILIAAALLLFTCISYGQESVKARDKEVRKASKGKIDRIKIGKGANGWAIFYNKEDKSIFSVSHREIEDKKWPDSALTYSFNYKNDTLSGYIFHGPTG